MTSRFFALLTAGALLPLGACQTPDNTPLPPPEESPNQPEGDPSIPQQPEETPNQPEGDPIIPQQPDNSPN